MIKISFYPLDQESLTLSTDKTKFTIGRGSKADLIVPTDGLSRLHCEFEIKNNKIYITDLGSTNGVFIDHQRISMNTPIFYHPDFTLAIGSIPIVLVDADFVEDLPKIPKLEIPHDNTEKSGFIEVKTRREETSKNDEESSSPSDLLEKVGMNRELEFNFSQSNIQIPVPIEVQHSKTAQKPYSKRVIKNKGPQKKAPTSEGPSVWAILLGLALAVFILWFFG